MAKSVCARSAELTPPTPMTGILPSTTFALAQQASSCEHSKAFRKDDDDMEDAEEKNDIRWLKNYMRACPNKQSPKMLQKLHNSEHQPTTISRALAARAFCHRPPLGSEYET